MSADDFVTDEHSWETPTLRIHELINFRTNRRAFIIKAGRTHIKELKKTADYPGKTATNKLGISYHN